MAGDPTQRHPREGVPLGRSADAVCFGPCYATATPRARKLCWRIRDILRRPVRNSAGHR
ncbi:hypothetical protein [Streptomyces sp. PR69]|uniref:hypothetical protein n=1 Tax=Streptomyces sp. PR69 TaxID=2984950 RepID=UPI002264A8D5|nr:hypothetical protein [Streptomyces sp. PR69]